MLGWTLLLLRDCSILALIMLSVKQSNINYHYLSFLSYGWLVFFVFFLFFFFMWRNDYDTSTLVGYLMLNDIHMNVSIDDF